MNTLSDNKQRNELDNVGEILCSAGRGVDRIEADGIIGASAGRVSKGYDKAETFTSVLDTNDRP